MTTRRKVATPGAPEKAPTTAEQADAALEHITGNDPEPEAPQDQSNNETSLKGNETYTKNTITTNVYSNNPYKKIHRAVMHPDVCYWLIDNFTKENDLILDIFSGVGTTAYCSLERGRKYIGFEINKEYWEISNERLAERKMQTTLF